MVDEEILAAVFDAQINVKMSRDLRERLRRIEARHGTPVPEILRRLGAAAAEYFEENGYLTFPVTIVPQVFAQPPAPVPKPRAAPRSSPKPRPRARPPGKP